MRAPRVIRVIETAISRGTGVKPDPFRTVIQYHTFNGSFLAENDPEINTQEFKFGIAIKGDKN